MDFIDLNDDVGADDWLISREEITRRKLVKQTPRYNIYKADWFGDVLVYEPARRKCDDTTTQQEKLASRRQNQHLNNRQYSDFNIQIGDNTHQEISKQMNELNIKLSNLDNWQLRSTTITTKEQLSPTLSCCSEQNDSAYSSISSTPQYHTKHIKSEFQFPSSKSTYPSMTSITSEDYFSSEPVELDVRKTRPHYNNAQVHQLEVVSKLPFQLNKESFKFGQFTQQQSDNDYDGSEKNYCEEDCSSQGSCWSELNELRLVAHESFMLFMGASMESFSDTATDQAASLVMQMSHPKAISLFNLLHATNQGNSLSLDR